MISGQNVRSTDPTSYAVNDQIIQRLLLLLDEKRGSIHSLSINE